MTTAVIPPAVRAEINYVSKPMVFSITQHLRLICAAYTQPRFTDSASRGVNAKSAAVGELAEFRAALTETEDSSLRVCFAACYFFLPAASLAFVACCDVINCCFLLFASLLLDCFCDAFFCTDFGDLSPMVGFPFTEGCLTLGMFVSPKAFQIIPESGGIVNNRRRRNKIIWHARRRDSHKTPLARRLAMESRPRWCGCYTNVP